MKYRYILLIRFAIVFVAIALSLIIYSYIVEPYILIPLCLINSNKCIRVSYWNYENSALIHMEPAGYWVFFNGDKAYVYGIFTGNECEPDPDGKIQYSPAYPVDPVSGLPTPYKCIQTLDEIQNFYKSKGAKKQFIYKRQDVNKFSVRDVLNLLADKNIINLANIKK